MRLNTGNSTCDPTLDFNTGILILIIYNKVYIIKTNYCYYIYMSIYIINSDTVYMCLWFSQTDTDTKIYFTHFTNTDTPYFWAPQADSISFFYLGRLHPQAHTTFTSFLGPNIFTSPQVFFFDWAKITTSPYCSFFFFLLCVACHTNTRTKSLMHFEFHTCLFPLFLLTRHTTLPMRS